jgi:hypothetical protein
MSIFDEDEPEGRRNEDGDQQDQTSYRGLVVLLLMLPLIIFPFFTDRTELIIGVSMSASVNCVAIIMCWDLRKHVWFWIVVVVMQSLYISLAYLAHWPKVTMTKLTLLPFGVMYYGLTVGVARAIAKIARESSSSPENIRAKESDTGPET